ncbi:caspase family protein [bacterium]|nr:MAG: caspase family protein [bacterium]
MRGLLPLAFLGLASLAQADRTAVLVGVDDYAWIKSPVQKLKGAENDVSLMSRTLALYGFKNQTLLRKDATSVRIGEALASLVGAAKKGDQVVFYFSGRGSVAAGGEPSLVPADGIANSASQDLTLGQLELWADRMITKGAVPTIVLDASFVNPARSDFGRQYNPTPRCIVRSGAPAIRRDLYKGKGVFLSACPATGAAYEWLVNSAQEKWAGAFTDQLANALVASLNRGQSPTYVDAMRDVQGYFKDKVRANYMPGLAPQPPMETLVAEAARYDAPAFGGLNPSELPADSKAALAAADRQRLAREGKYRVAFETVDPKLRPAVQKELEAFLKRQVPGAVFAPVGEPPDLILKISTVGKDIESSVVGDDLDKAQVYRFKGRDFKKTLSEGLGDYLELRSLIARLYRLTEGGKPTWNGDVRFSSPNATLARGDGFSVVVEAPEPALFFVLTRDDADGVLQLAFPQPGAPYSQKVVTKTTLEAQIQNDSSDGRMMLRAILIPLAKTKARELKMDDPKFRTVLLAQLRTILPTLEEGKTPWAVKTIDLRIR